MLNRTTLDNGLRIVTYSMPKMRSVSMGVWVRIGARYETFQNKGIAHYLEHMVFKGTKNYSCRQLKESIEGVGGSLNGFTSEEATCYLAKLPHQHLPMASDILFDMVMNPVISSSDTEKERAVILEEIKMYQDLPQSRVYDLLDGLLWPKQVLGMSVLGVPESVSNITREDISGFRKRYYTSSNIVVSAAGSFSHKDIVHWIKEKFRSVSVGQRNDFLRAHQAQKRPQLDILAKDTEQTHLALGFHSYRKDHPLRYALDLLHIIMGANMSSRLFNEIRENKGLAYEIGTAVKRYSDTGLFLIHAGINNNKVLEAIKLILKELKDITDKLVSFDELRRAKEFALGQLMLSLEDTMDNMLWIGESVVSLDKVYSLKEIIKGIQTVSRKDIRIVSQEIIKGEHLNLAVIGPVKKNKNLILKQLNI